MAAAPEGILCSKTHEWVLDGGGDFSIGLTDYAVEQLGDIVFVELPEVGAAFGKGEPFATVESVKAASEVYMPVSGKVVAVNEALIASPELLNEDVWGSWFVKIAPENATEETIGLLEYEDYTEEVS